MTDQNSQFFAILTAVGEAKQANAAALGTSWTFAQMGVGDANETAPIPNRLQTKLINERRRAPLNQVKVDPTNPSVIIAEQIIPESVGGWWVRELALYDTDGDMVAVANCAPTYKPLLAQGSGRTQVIRINLIVSSTANIELKIDPSVVLATREYVDESLEAILPGNKAPGTYRQVTINKYGIVVSGTNPTTLGGYGITDAISSAAQPGLVGTIADITKTTFGSYVATTPDRPSSDGVFVRIKFPATNAAFDIAGHLGNGTDQFCFRRVLADGTFVWRTVWHDGNFDPQLKANLASPAFTGTPTAPTAAVGTRTKQLSTTEFVQLAIESIVAAAPGSLDTLKELADALGGDPNFATTVINALALKAEKDKALAVGSVSQQVPIVAASKSGNNYDASAMIVREAGEVGAAQDTEAYAPSIGFHWLGRTTGRLIMDALGTLKWNGQSLLAGTIGTQNEIDASTSNTAVVTPRTLKFGFSFIKGGGNGNCAIVFPSWLGGLIVQWGVHIANTPDAETSVTFPVSFNVIPGCVSWLTHDGATQGQSGVTTQGRILTATGFQSRREDIGSTFTFSGTAYIRWIALGY
ncbi:phage tail protein [Pseudomonas sp. SB113]|uniref:phage tail protein n=1 Tax=Pseudomonas sp. SB113 TaxID=3154123 RepID=UPI00345DCE55